MIQEAGTVAIATAINYPSVREPEDEGVCDMGAAPRGRPPPAGQLTPVFDKPLAGRDGPQGKESRHAPERRAVIRPCCTCEVLFEPFRAMSRSRTIHACYS